MTNFRNQIRKLLIDYDFGCLVSIDDQSHGYANQNFRIKTDKGKFFVRVCLQQSIAYVEQEVLLMEALKQNNFRTAFPVERRDGSILSKISGVPVLVYEFIEGELPRLNTTVVSEIAEAAADLSQINYPETLTKKNAISIDDSIAITKSETFLSYSNKDVTENFSSFIDLLHKNIRHKLPTGIVHGDIFPDNTIFRDDKLCAIIDFEEFAIDNLLFDVGMTINGFCFEETKLNTAYLDCFLSSYNSKRKLTVVEKELIVDYMAWGAVGMTSWHLSQLLFKKNRKQLARVRVLLERASFILDNRKQIEQIVKESLLH